MNANDAEGDDGGIIAEKAQQRLRKERGRKRQRRHEAAPHLKGRSGDGKAALHVPRAVVDPDKRRHRLSEGVHKAVHVELNGERRRGGGHRVGSEAVEGGLNEDVRQGENHPLRPSGDPDAHDTEQLNGRQAELSGRQADFRPSLSQQHPEDERIHHIRDDRRPNYPREAKPQMNRRHIENRIQQAGRDEAVEGRPAVAGTAKDRCFKIIQGQKGQPTRKMRQ